MCVCILTRAPIYIYIYLYISHMHIIHSHAPGMLHVKGCLYIRPYSRGSCSRDNAYFINVFIMFLALAVVHDWVVHHCLSTKIKLAQWNSLQYLRVFFFGNFILRYVLFNLFIVETVSHAQPFYQRGSGIPEQAWHLALQGRVDFNILLKQCGNSWNGGRKFITYNL